MTSQKWVAIARGILFQTAQTDDEGDHRALSNIYEN